MSGGIFISYRRDDAKHAAGRLVDRLAQTLRPEQLFIDVDNIEPGLDFRKVLSERVQACDVLLAVIGPGWLESRDENGGRRLDNPADFVRIEIEAALVRDVRVVPVLVDGAAMPAEEDLPNPLRPLAARQAVRLAHERFGSDAGDLAGALAKMLPAATKVQSTKLSSGSVSVDRSALWQVELIYRRKSGFAIDLSRAQEVHRLEFEVGWVGGWDTIIVNGKKRRVHPVVEGLPN